MSRFSRFFGRLYQITAPLSQTYIIDMGSVFTRVMVDGRVVFFEPTCLVVHKGTQAIIAFGQKAADLRGKLPPTLSFIEPVRRGKLQETTYGAAFLEIVLREGIHLRNKKNTLRQHIILNKPCNITPTYRQALERVATQAGLVLKETKDQPTAVYRWLLKQQTTTDQACILVIGGDISEMSFISQGETVASQRIKFGGNDVTKALQHTIKQFHQLEIGMDVAERLKKELAGLTFKSNQPKHMVVKGKDIIKNIPTARKISTLSDEWSMASVCEKQLVFLVEGIQQFFQQLPPDLLTHTLDKGIFVTGGGSQLQGLSSYLEQKFHTTINISETPEIDVIHGLYANTI